MLARDPNTCLDRSMLVPRKPRDARRNIRLAWIQDGIADMLGDCEGVEDLLGSLEGPKVTEGCPEGADDMLRSRVGIDDTL